MHDKVAEHAIDWKIDHPSCRLALADWLTGVGHLQTQSIDLLYVDPPFMTGTAQNGRSGSFDDRWADTSQYMNWMKDRLESTIPRLRMSGSVLIHVDWRVSHRIRVLLDELLGESRFVNHLVWAYGLGGSSPRRFARKHDDILFYCLNPDLYWFDPPLIPATSRRMAGQSKKATDVLMIPSINNMAKERTGWPTQKPLELLKLLIGACCPPGGTVLDPCCGSGTTLVAAGQLNRRAIGFDVSGDAIAIAQQRMEQFIAAGATSCGA